MYTRPNLVHAAHVNNDLFGYPGLHNIGYAAVIDELSIIIAC